MIDAGQRSVAPRLAHPARSHTDGAETGWRGGTPRGPRDRGVGDQFSLFPYSAIGKLFMTFPNAPGANKNYQGSAWAIGEKAIFTAGHCLFDHTLGGAANAVVFAGHYRQGQYLKKWTVVNKA